MSTEESTGSESGTVGELRDDDHWIIERSGTPVDVDGFKMGEPADHIICAHCFRAASHYKQVTHAADCTNPDAHTT
ncbi:hypothetical protein [Halorientalis sp.]|jgi:hypothetical protein|uniref:hypothetical protein n=1 Tax=Halorientalis sp. TaxID=1931229 RepID=UPI002623B1AA|nr:hypothetical protein [Halorientalis sp.]